jgi:hypothetical protein
MSIGNYAQAEKRGGISWLEKELDAWRNLFHKGGNVGFEGTRTVLLQLLSRRETFSDDALRAMVEAYLSECEADHRFEWRYYYIKYSLFSRAGMGNTT